MELKELNKISPPYIPWETLKGFFKTISKSAVPSRIDSSMMPTTMSGFNKAGVTTALKFFSLIDSNGDTTNNLKEIVDAYETDRWPEAVKKYLMPAYNNIIGDLELNTATRKQLDEKFGNTSSAMKDRFIRFYIPMLQDAGEQISPYLTIRQNRPAKTGPKKITNKKKNIVAEKENPNGDTPSQIPQSAPEGMFDLPIPIMSDNKSFIRIPRNITVSQAAMVKTFIGVIEAMAKQNEENQ